MCRVCNALRLCVLQLAGNLPRRLRCVSVPVQISLFLCQVDTLERRARRALLRDGSPSCVMSVGQSFVCIFLARIHLFRKIKAFKPVQPLFLYRFVMFVGCVNFVRPQEEFMRNEIAINRDLVGNLMIYLATECKPLYHTKLIKLLYLIDEESTRRNGSPLTWLSYKAWKLGPVSQEVYYSKNASENRFAGYVRFVHKKDAVLVEPVAVFLTSRRVGIRLCNSAT